MIAITPQMRILCFIRPVDFRAGIDGLLGHCRRELQVDPFSGVLFVFRNRKGTAIKMVVYDGQGYWLLMKRLSSGHFNYWPTSSDDNGPVLDLLSRDLSVLLWNGNPRKALMSEDFKKIE